MINYKIFGCKVNKYYTDKWVNSKYLSDKKGVFVSSCVVTDNAKKKWIKFIKNEAIKLKNDEKIFISWCWVFDKWSKLETFFEIYPELCNIKEKIEILQEEPDKKEFLEEKINKLKSIYTKKFLIIQNWCDSFCSFCLTVQKRWKHRSRTKEDILKEILQFEQNWWKEIVLTWVNLWAWGLESTNDVWKSKLHILLQFILDNSNIKRIKISSLWPEFVNDELIKFFTHPRISPHFHFSLQSGSDKILKLMRRHYNSDKLRDIFKKIKQIKRSDNLDISIWADIIVWFPSETENDFLDTYNMVSDFGITKLHAFPFSAHKIWENVPARFFPNQIDENTKKERLKRLISLWDKIRNNFLSSQKWKIFEVLIESKSWNNFKWLTHNYIEVNEKNFEVYSWEIKKNEIVVGKFIW